MNFFIRKTANGLERPRGFCVGAHFTCVPATTKSTPTRNLDQQPYCVTVFSLRGLGFSP